MQLRTPQSGIPRVVNEFNLGNLSNETLTSNKNFCYTHANKITIFPPFPVCPSSKRQKLSRLLYVDISHKIMHKEFLNKLQLTVMKDII